MRPLSGVWDQNDHPERSLDRLINGRDQFRLGLPRTHELHLNPVTQTTDTKILTEANTKTILRTNLELTDSDRTASSISNHVNRQ